MDSYLKWFIGIGLALFLICMFFPAMILPEYGYDWDKTSKVGDTFNVLNTFFSALAFAGIIVTILIQKRELKHQREELSLQRNEMKQTREEFLTNRITTVIYNQLEKYEALVNNFSVNSQTGLYFDEAGSEIRGASAFLEIERSLGKGNENDTTEDQMKAIKNAYNFLLYNQYPLLNFSIGAYSIVGVVMEVLTLSELPIPVLKSLKRLFFSNIGIEQLDIIEDVVKLEKKMFGFYQIDKSFKVDEGKIPKVTLNFRSVISARKAIINEHYISKFKHKVEASLDDYI
jgi:hypothetical protein